MAKRKRKLRIRRYDIDHKLEKDILLDLGYLINHYKKSIKEHEGYLKEHYTSILNEYKKRLNYLCTAFNKATPLNEDLELLLPYLPEID